MSELQEAVNVSQDLSSRKQALLKLLLCRGLYPQLALPDEHNTARKDSEQVGPAAPLQRRWHSQGLRLKFCRVSHCAGVPHKEQAGGGDPSDQRVCQ